MNNPFDRDYPIVPRVKRCEPSVVGWVVVTNWREYQSSGKGRVRQIAILRGLWSVVHYRLLRRHCWYLRLRRHSCLCRKCYPRYAKKRGFA